MAFYLSGIYNAGLDAPLPPYAYAALALSFGALGLLLVVTNRNDVRAVWLGGVLLLLAVPLTSRFVLQTPLALGTWLTRVEPGAFLPAFLWRFAYEFPSPLTKRSVIVRLIGGITVAFGVAAFAVNLSIAPWPLDGSVDWRTWLATGRASPSVYWPTLFLLNIVAAVALLVRLVRSRSGDRRRVQIFLGGLLVGLLPLSLQIIVEALWPSYATFVHHPTVRPWVALLLFGPLALVPLVTAYSVVYDQVVTTRLVIRTAIQHALAKYTIAVATLVPFAALGVYVYQYRAEPLVALLSGPRPLVLTAGIAAGIVSLRARRRILHAIDRRFFREVYDASTLVTTIIGDHAMASSLSSVAAVARNEIDRALHARADLYLLDDDGVSLKDTRGQRPPLDARSVLLSLAGGSAHPMDARLKGDSPLLQRLPRHERAWLAGGEYELLLPIRSRQDEIVGLLALSGKRSELPFSATDRRSLAAIAPPLGLAIENERLRRMPGPTTTGRECRACRRVHAGDADRCTCGGPVEPAEVPHVLRGVYRLERRIGSGGMGVVYQATDLTLRRPVAVKTLPQLHPNHGAQLTREARAMASVNHPNLATVYGIETWRDTPFIIEEFMVAGTLADRVRRHPLALAEVLRLGSALADVLAHLHRSGIIHCDVKPSNIGFIREDVPKLLDFGVASLLREVGDALASTTTAARDAPHLDLKTRVSERGVVGTPAYMSPEAATGGVPTPLFDLWSLAVTLFESLAGQRPFSGRRLEEVMLDIAAGERRDMLRLRPDCPDHLARFFDEALAIDSRQRPQTAEEFKARLSYCS
jgi:hypothetical protein